VSAPTAQPRHLERLGASQHAATQGACEADENDLLPEPRDSAQGDVDERVRRRVGRLATVLRQAAQIIESLGEDLQDVLAAAARQRDMSDVPEAKEQHEEERVDRANESPKALLGVPELADLFEVKESTVRRWRRSGKLPPAVQIGGVLRWRQETIDAWLEEREVSS